VSAPLYSLSPPCQHCPQLRWEPQCVASTLQPQQQPMPRTRPCKLSALFQSAGNTVQDPATCKQTLTHPLAQWTCPPRCLSKQGLATTTTNSDTDAWHSFLHYRYYILILACVVGKDIQWLRNACLAAALLFPAVAALHGIVLASLHLDGKSLVALEGLTADKKL